ncbi:MAG: hypothetical protein QF489_04855 [Planctomycetota bacterium]|jgi:hypothetical protein|nr:hypothetical protein [Planctomycetota bacterium]
MRLRQNHDGILLLNGRRIFLIAGILIFAFGELFGLAAIGFGVLVLGVMGGCYADANT